MRIIIITQNEPFYLAENIRFLIKSLSKEVEIVGVVLSNPSPFGKKESFIKKSIKTLNIFGIKFFLYYSFKYLNSILDNSKNVKFTLEKMQIPIITLENSINNSASIKKLKTYKPDLIISILGNEIFKKDLISLPKEGIINLHSSLLPKYRGLMPCFWVLKNNEKYTGVSVFLVDNGIDSGPILVREKISIGKMNHRQLIKETKAKGMHAICKAVSMIKNNKKVLIPNPDKSMSYYNFPKKEDVIQFHKIGKSFF